jgi:hypothetical protein
MSALLQINVNEHTEKKNGLTYLSWAWAWAEVLKVDPQATWEAVEFNGLPCALLPDSSAMVKVVVTISGHSKSCWLPVMDHKNKAIKGPDAFAINTALVRCLTKCISMHGLGLYIYAGEDLPEPTADDKARESRDNELTDLALTMIDLHKRGKDMEAVKLWYAADTFAQDAGAANDERLHVWGLLKTESALRSAIKANKPETAAA